MLLGFGGRLAVVMLAQRLRDGLLPAPGATTEPEEEKRP
jgi:hypothetical protein